MNKLLAKIGLGEKMSKNFLAILIVAFGGAIIYGLPYFHTNYPDGIFDRNRSRWILTSASTWF